MFKEYKNLKKFAEGILYAFTLPERQAYIDEDKGNVYITENESEKRIFVFFGSMIFFLRSIIIILIVSVIGIDPLTLNVGEYINSRNS